MKTYLKSIERRLNLPKDVRRRVMSDFADSVEARREAGQTDAQIMADLGEPKKVASELNEQMKEYAYRKSPWRFLFLGAAVLSGGWLLLYRLLLRFGMLLDTLTVRFSPNEAASIGMIGSADGPTAIFVASTASRGFDWDVVIMTAILVVGILGFLLLRKCKRK